MAALPAPPLKRMGCSAPAPPCALQAALRLQRRQLGADGGEALPPREELRHLLHAGRHGQPEDHPQQRAAGKAGRHALHKYASVCRTPGAGALPLLPLVPLLSLLSLLLAQP